MSKTGSKLSQLTQKQLYVTDKSKQDLNLADQLLQKKTQILITKYWNKMSVVHPDMYFTE